MSTLIVATHPDDDVLGCGGVIARRSREGIDVHVVIVTRGIPDLFSVSQIEATRSELSKAHALLGVSTARYLDFPAPRLDVTPNHQIADALRDCIEDVKPYEVFIPHHGDVHLDHQRTFQASLVAARPVGTAAPRKLMTYEVLSETEWSAPVGLQSFNPNTFVDISNTLQCKLEAMALIKSQLKSFPHPRSLPAIQALAEYRGATVGFAAAEAFTVIRSVC